MLLYLSVKRVAKLIIVNYNKILAKRFSAILIYSNMKILNA